MPEAINTFTNLVFLGLIALFPVINPIGAAFIVSPYFSGLSKLDRRNAVKKVSIYVLIFCSITLFVGHYILTLFGITVPVVQLAGGIMICKFGWEMLGAKPTEGEVQNTEETDGMTKMSDLRNKLFYPIAFPMTVGAGTISVIFTLSAHTEAIAFQSHLMNLGAIFVAILIMSLSVFLLYTNATRVVKFIGSRNEQIVNRVMAFLIFCVGLQIAASGVFNLLRSMGVEV